METKTRLIDPSFVQFRLRLLEIPNVYYLSLSLSAVYWKSEECQFYVWINTFLALSIIVLSHVLHQGKSEYQAFFSFQTKLLFLLLFQFLFQFQKSPPTSNFFLWNLSCRIHYQIQYTRLNAQLCFTIRRGRGGGILYGIEHFRHLHLLKPEGC